MEQLDTILNKSEELFFKIGIKSVTMDDISKELGISKKTLYQYVSNKKDLVEKVIKRYVAKEACFMEAIDLEKLNAIDIIVEIIKHVNITLRTLPYSAMYDLQKYHPNSWKIIENFKGEFVRATMEAIISKGKNEGLFRKSINEKIISKFYVLSVDSTLNPDNFPREGYKIQDVYLEYIIYHLHGLVSEKGKNYLKTINLNNE